MSHVSLDLHLEEREPRRVVLSLLVDPGDAPVVLDGIALRLVDAAGQTLGARLQLPIAGTLQAPLATTVELRSPEPLPHGATVEATAWHDPTGLQATVSVPTEPFPRLRDHMRKADVGLDDLDEVVLRPLDAEERRTLAARLPWIDQPVHAPSPVIELQDEPTREDFERDYGLDPSDAAWLEELLSDSDEDSGSGSGSI